ALDPGRRPRAAELADGIRHAYHARRGRKPVAKRAGPRATQKPLVFVNTRPPARVAFAGLAGIAAGWTAAALPFFPSPFPFGLAALAFGLTLVRERLGPGAALAVPVFPLRNVSPGLAVVHVAVPGVGPPPVLSGP